MTDSNCYSWDQLESTLCMTRNWQAECLLSVIAPMLDAMQSAQTGTVESAAQLYEVRQTFRDCVGSVCHRLSAEEIEQILVLTLVTLCERLTDSASC